MLFLRLCLICGILLTFAPLFSFIDGRAAAFQAFAVQLAVGNAILALVLLAFRFRAWAILGLIATFWNIALVWPTLVNQATADAKGPALKVIGLNIWFENADLAKTVTFLAKSDADLIGLSEVTPESKPALAALKSIYPYSIDCIGKDPFCQLVLLSKRPMRYAFAGKVGAKLTYVASADVEWQGRNISVVVTHMILPFVKPDWPPIVSLVPADDASPMLPGTPPLWQSMQAAVLADYVSTLGPERILMGDFNSTTWSELQRAFRTATRLDNRGPLALTWPAWAPLPLRIPIDSIFVGGQLGLRDSRAGRDVGSDHLPVIAEIEISP